MIGFFGANGYVAEIKDARSSGEYIISAIEGKVSDAEFVEAVRPSVRPGLTGR